MYGPNYVKLSRVFAVQLFGMIIEHYAALPPVRLDPHWPHIHAITASIRLALIHTLQHTLLATQTSAVATTACLGYLHPHALTMRPSTASFTDIPLRLLLTDIGCVTRLAPRSRQDTATHTARDSNLDISNHAMPRLSAICTRSHAWTMRPSTASPIYLCACSQPLRLWRCVYTPKVSVEVR
jgi:hypothetical protein